jgi:hypothetical protein
MRHHADINLDVEFRKELYFEIDMLTPPTLTMDQRIGRELYIFAKTNQRKSQAARIYANVGLACLAICKHAYPIKIGFMFMQKNISPSPLELQGLLTPTKQVTKFLL